MADNTTLNPGVGGDTVREVDRAGVKTQVVLLDVGGLGGESLFTGHIIVDSGSITTGGLTDAQLRATPVPVSGTVTVNTISGFALETGNLATLAGKDFATQATLALIKAKTDNIDVALSTRTKPADQQHVIVDSGSITTGGLTDAQLRASQVPVTTTQNVIASTLNSSTANLASGASFIGASESTLGVNALQINHFADQPCTIQLQQSTDGTNYDQVGAVVRVEFNTGFYRTYQATGSYFRVVVVNVGLVPTTAFRLQTALCPEVDVVPPELSPAGNLKVAVQEGVMAKEAGGNIAAIYNYHQQIHRDLLERILIELRILTAFVSQGLNVRDDPNLFRSDPTILQ